MALTRRRVLAVAACGALAGCAGRPAVVAGGVASASGAAASGGGVAVPEAVEPQVVGPEPPAPAAPAPAAPAPARPVTRAEAAARYAGLAPELWGTEVPGVLTRLPEGERTVALTFDACGGPGGSGYDAELIDFLRAGGIPATLFLNARWIDANPAVAEQLAADPLFELANHGTAHRPLSVTGRSAYGIPGTADAAEAYDEIAANTEKLTALLGHPPRFFRSGTAHYDEIAVRIATDLGTRVAGFTVNADGGATFSAVQVYAELAAAPPGAIVIGHFNHPGSGTAPGVATAVPALRAAGYRFVRLSDALG